MSRLLSVIGGIAQRQEIVPRQIDCAAAASESHPPLAFSVVPDPDESLVGFLIRLAEANFLRTASPILTLAGAKHQQPPTLKDIPRLADLCGCHPDQLIDLFGLVKKTENGSTVWRLANEWITKPYFVSSRTLAFCPICLTEMPRLRCLWELTLYSVCAIHGIRLVDRCPSCSRPARWQRSTITHCICGGQFGEADRVPESGYGLLVARLIEQHLPGSRQLSVPSLLPDHMLRRLTNLSLDALFKTLWLFGRQLPDARSRKTGQGLHRPRPTEALEIIEGACTCLTNWPSAFYKKVEDLAGHSPCGSPETVFGPIHRYLQEEMEGEELAFVRNAYERQIRLLWLAMGRREPRVFGRQYELDFEAPAT